MSANAVRMPEINLEEFERRLRAAGDSAETVDDPLEELTRLVSSIASQRGRAETPGGMHPSRPAGLNRGPAALIASESAGACARGRGGASGGS